jgi:hypothetical protein
LTKERLRSQKWEIPVLVGHILNLDGVGRNVSIVNTDRSLILVASTCGGKDGIPKPPEFKKLQSDIVNKTLNNISITVEEIKSLNSASLGSGWINLHPESRYSSKHYNIPTNEAWCDP